MPFFNNLSVTPHGVIDVTDPVSYFQIQSLFHSSIIKQIPEEEKAFQRPGGDEGQLIYIHNNSRG